jgi:GNAT superfamily N-acetyltransferase
VSQQPPPHSPVIRHLDASHVRQHFDCGEPKLNDYLLHFASQHQRRQIGRTFVLLRQPDPRVLGFYTLAASSVAFVHLLESEKLPKYPVPVVKLAQLAVDQSLRGQGWGEFLLFDALARAERISREVAVYAVELDALTDTARAFYLKYGFVSLKDDPHHLYIPMKRITELRLNSP